MKLSIIGDGRITCYKLPTGVKSRVVNLLTGIESWCLSSKEEIERYPTANVTVLINDKSKVFQGKAIAYVCSPEEYLKNLETK